jgi:Pyruvate/2-oxoacid:ferredoxin oxidoreductase delta subunit
VIGGRLNPWLRVTSVLTAFYAGSIAIVRNEKGVEINYDYCKGCGICAKECPKQAIKMMEEKK